MYSPMDRGPGFAMTFVIFQLTFFASTYFTVCHQPLLVSVPTVFFLMHHLKHEIQFFASDLRRRKRTD